MTKVSYTTSTTMLLDCGATSSTIEEVFLSVVLWLQKWKLKNKQFLLQNLGENFPQ